MDTTSHHFLIELNSVDYSLLDDVLAIENIFLDAVRKSSATYVNHYFHKFSPHGVSGVVVIAESHLSIHTWPENGYAALDVFTCGEKSIGDTIVFNILKSFNTDEYTVTYLLRGVNYKNLVKSYE
jgi:S-adenosylmethionine decarboxylase